MAINLLPVENPPAVDIVLTDMPESVTVYRFTDGGQLELVRGALNLRTNGGSLVIRDGEAPHAPVAYQVRDAGTDEVEGQAATDLSQIPGWWLKRPGFPAMSVEVRVDFGSSEGSRESTGSVIYPKGSKIGIRVGESRREPVRTLTFIADGAAEVAAVDALLDTDEALLIEPPPGEWRLPRSYIGLGSDVKIRPLSRSEHLVEYVTDIAPVVPPFGGAGVRVTWDEAQAYANNLDAETWDEAQVDVFDNGTWLAAELQVG
ncbi:MAG: hypothetical protein WAS05_00820 [Candidatus Nanopelagicales bacterium]